MKQQYPFNMKSTLVKVSLNRGNLHDGNANKATLWLFMLK